MRRTAKDRIRRAASETGAARVRINGRDPVSQLYRAVIRYVESKGGAIAVIGNVEIQEWPGDPKFNFRLAVRCTGRKPVIAGVE
jgi:hypothetical protein